MRVFHSDTPKNKRAGVTHVMLELSKPKSTSINHRKFVNYSTLDNDSSKYCTQYVNCIQPLWSNTL